ncbi:MAG: lamin tail domain-containing protein [Candidatus Nanoarchaeia archaeon]|nr:lamin tail domain-containing protein [Candidatus Nanoarchaeia archaeon]
MWRILIFLILVSTAEANVITEIFYNPDEEDNNQEYVEINLPNLSGYTIYDLNSGDNLTLINYFDSNYSLIVEEGFNYSGINASIYSAGASIGNNLNNDEDLLILKDYKNEVVDIAYYSSKMGGNGNNKSLCRKEFTFVECVSSPGFEQKINFTIRINEFMPNPEGYDSENEWLELYNYGEYSLDLEGFSLTDNSGKKIFISGVLTNNTIIKSKDYMVIQLHNFSGFLNNDGYEKIILEGIDEISYSGSSEGVSWSKLNNGWSKSVPTPGEVNVEKNLGTRIKIEKINMGSDKKTKFGDIIYVRFNILRGETTKKSLNIHIINASKSTKINLNNRFVNNEFTLPIKLEEVCQESGLYELLIEGLDEKESTKVEVNKNDKYCNKTTTTKDIKKIPLKSIKSERVLNDETEEVIYKSKDIEARQLGIYFFCMSLILLLIYFTWIL